MAAAARIVDSFAAPDILAVVQPVDMAAVIVLMVVGRVQVES